MNPRNRSMALESYIDGLQGVLERIKREQAGNIKRAGQVVAAAISARRSDSHFRNRTFAFDRA